MLTAVGFGVFAIAKLFHFSHQTLKEWGQFSFISSLARVMSVA